MKSIILFTDNPIDCTTCEKALKPVFPKIDIKDPYVFFGKPPKSFSFELEYKRDQESFEPLSKEMASRIPINNPYCTVIDFHFEDMMKQVVTAFMPYYPELFIYEDQIDWYGAADEYIKLDYSEYYYPDYSKKPKCYHK